MRAGLIAISNKIKHAAVYIWPPVTSCIKMRSTIVIFIIVFAILGLLLGYAESTDTVHSTNGSLNGTQNHLVFRNNSGEPCESNSTGCIAVYQKP